MKVTILLLLITLQHATDVNGITRIYDARLNGSSIHQGTVEVLTYRGWLPVCERYTYSWGTAESRVLCRQLGYDYSSTSSSSLTSTSSVDFSFSCSGIESELSRCSYSFYRETTYCSSRIVTVSCTPCTSGSVQLRGGIVPEAGRIEYCHDGEWKAVCHNNWGYQDAFVVCRQLGLPATEAVGYQNSYFGDHPFRTGINSVNCFGNESSIANCSFTSSSCNSRNGAGVFCTGDGITELCIEGHLRLAGGKDANEGRVEICSNGVWGTIYTGGWDSLDAIVVCKQLGLYQTYSRVEVFHYNYFGAGTGPVLFSYLDCDGTESTLSDCYSSTSTYLYSHSDAGVRCNRIAITTRSDCSNGDVRLVNGTTPSEGRVEICYDGVWGSVCDSGWDSNNAVIVCRQMGFQRINATALRGSHFGDGDGPYHLSGVSCSGEERTLLQCSYGSSTVGYHTCSSGGDAGVRCDASVTCNHGEVRLFGGYTDNDGIAEVCIDGQWADICYNSVSDRTTFGRVFCRQLIGQEPWFYISSCCERQHNGGNMTLFNINCNNQSRGFVHDCTYSVVMEYNTAPASGCTLQNELIIGCYEQSSCSNSGDLRLRDGNSTHEGRVELCSQGLWGRISDRYNSWNSRYAMVVCRQLGYPWEWALAETYNIFGRGNTPTFSANLYCRGYEQQLLQCSNSRISISQSATNRNTLGVICQGNTSAPTECQHSDVRLVDGRNKAEGRLELCANGYWALPCDDQWNIIGTEIVCKQLGLPTNGSMYRSGSPFGSNYQLPIIEVSCETGNTNISGCGFITLSYYTYNNCNHRKNIGIYCQEREEQYYIVKVDILPAQKSYEIGTWVTFNCTISPTPVYQTSSIVYEWYSSVRGGRISSSSISTLSTTIPAYHTDSADYYCHPLHNGRLLGRGKATLTVKDLLQRNVSGTSSGSIRVNEQDTISLRVETTAMNTVKGLLGLAWYHNGVIIAPNCDTRFTFSNNNKTLTISNFTSTDAGTYKAQFDQLFVHPFDEDCRDEVLSLMRHLPILKPAVFCVNVDDNCSDVNLEAQEREISVKVTNSDLQGTLSRINLEAKGQLLTSKELEYSYIAWYRSGSRITSSSYSLSTLQRQCSNLSLSQGLQQINATYEHSGQYEVLLRIRMSSYLQAGNCRPYYNRFVSYYISSQVTLARRFVDVGFHKALMFDLHGNKKATTGNDGATLICQASIEFPPFSMLSFIKNGQTVATSSNGLLEINTRSVNTNPFGLYTCQLNASGEIFQKVIQLKEQANLRMTMSGENCVKSAIEDALVLKISSECRCSFNKSYLHDSSIDCKGNNELVYTTTLEYSTDNGSETASVIAERMIRQIPFSMAIGGTQLTVTSACTDCTNTVSLSPAVGGGLFIGGFIAAILIAIILVIITILVKKRCAKSKGKGGKSTAVKTDPLRYASTRAPHQDASFKGSQHAAPYPEKPCEYEPMGPLDQPSQYDAVPPIDQPIYEETF